MATIHEYRRENLRKLIDVSGGVTALSQRLGYTNGSFLVQMAGPAPIREVSEQTARKFEAKLGLEPGYFDLPTDVPAGQYSAASMRRARVEGSATISALIGGTAPAPAAPVADAVVLIKSVGAKATALGVALTTEKFANVVALMLEDSRSHAGTVREDYLETLLKLMK